LGTCISSYLLHPTPSDSCLSKIVRREEFSGKGIRKE
jgi:hypothetical protein